MNFIPVNEPLLHKEEKGYVRDCMESGWISSSGKYVKLFEDKWSDYCGREYGVSVCNGTAALHLALESLGLEQGTEVILPSFTIISCVNAILWAGLKPVLVDCEPDTYCMNIKEFEAKISSRTSAVMPVHIYGHPVEMKALMKIAEKHDLKVIEDASEAHGAECLFQKEWRKCGSFGDVSAFSFFGNKNISCGEGGMLLTDNENIYKKLLSKRNLCFGEKEKFTHEDMGWNYRMTNIQAAIGCGQLENIDSILEHKRNTAALYNEGLKNLPLRTPSIKKWAKSSVWMYAVLLEDEAPFSASEFARRLLEKNIQTRPFFTGMHMQPLFRNMGLFKEESFPVTDRIAQRGVYLPTGQTLKKEQIEYIIDKIKEIFNS